MYHEQKLFTIGPVQMYDHTLEQKSKQIQYFRTVEFSEMMNSINFRLGRVIGAEENSKYIHLTSSGTGAMEATVINCFNECDRLLVVVGGSFGKRFSDICTIHNIPHDDIILSEGEELSYKHLLPYENGHYTGFLVNLHETSTGQLYDINVIRNFCTSNGLILIIDAMTTFLCDKFNMKEYAADAVIISSQKGLSLSPGISIVVLNERIIERVMNNNPRALYFGFKDYIHNMERGQTPFTPAIGILEELSNQLTFIESEGIDNYLNEINIKATYFRNKISSIPAHYPSYSLSNAITPVVFEIPIATEMFKILKDEYKMIINPSSGDFSDYQIRISHIGNIQLSDYDELLSAMTAIYRRVGNA